MNRHHKSPLRHWTITKWIASAPSAYLRFPPPPESPWVAIPPLVKGPRTVSGIKFFKTWNAAANYVESHLHQDYVINPIGAQTK